MRRIATFIANMISAGGCASAGFAEAGALVPPTSVGRAPLERPAEHRFISQFRFDLQEAIIFCYPFATAGRAGLDLSAAHGNGKIRHECVLGFTGPVGNNKTPACLAAHIYGLNSLSNSPYLVQLYKNRVCCLLLDSTRNKPRIGDVKV